MATKAIRRPAAILETAYNSFREDDSLMKLVWENTKGGIALRKDRSTDDYVAAVEQHFYDHYKTLEKEAAGIKALTRRQSAKSYLVPAVLKGLSEVVPRTLGLSPPWEIVYGVLRGATIEASIPFLSDLLHCEDCDSYITQYRSLKWSLQDDPAVRVPLANLAEHVSRVFGRPLQTPDS
jgi:hypothetical protein